MRDATRDIVSRTARKSISEQGTDFMRSQAGIFLEPAHQAGPAGQGEQLGLKNVLPVGLPEILGIQVIQNRIRRRKGKVLLPLEFFVQASQISGKDAAAPG